MEDSDFEETGIKMTSIHLYVIVTLLLSKRRKMLIAKKSLL